LSVDGLLDLRWVHATGPLSYLDGGIGSLRFDPEHEDLRLGRAMLASRLRLTDTVTLHAVVDAYGDHNGNFADLSEFWLDVHPFPSQAVRWRARIGAFYMPLSLENRGPGWSDVYSITPSALNTWIGEEFRTIGAELEARWLGASTGYQGDLALIGAVYGWNEDAGQLLAERGFALSDRPSTLFGGLGIPSSGFYHEIDHRPGLYVGLDWHHHAWMEVRALRYDNRADPDAYTVAGGYAWNTRFSSLGLRLEPGADWTFIAQYLDGATTTIGEYTPGIQFQMSYRTGFALASYEWRAQRFTARLDEFRTRQLTGYYGPPADENGHAATLGWSYGLGDHWQVAAEWLRVWSTFPPRVLYGVPASIPATQYQIAVRYRFKLGI
jgi:hypothetical protein